MIPFNSLSSTPVQTNPLEAIPSNLVPLVDYEMGGVALNDASQGLWVKLWKVEVVANSVRIGPDGQPTVEVFTRPNVTEVSLAFDQNMQPAVAFVQSGVAWLWWYDSSVPGMVFTSFTGAINPRVTTDDKRPAQVGNSDIILAYLKSDGLYFRQQRDRYTIERLLSDEVPCGGLSYVVMNKGNRLQFAFGGN